MIADASQMLYISTISCLFSPRRGFAPGLAPERQSESKDTLSLHSEKNYTEKILHTEAFTQRGIYTEQLLHRRFCTQTLLYTEAFTQKSRHHRKPLNRAALHTDAFSQRSFYTQEL